MRWTQLLFGSRDDLRRPVNDVDAALMRRMADARRLLGDVQVKPVRNPLRRQSGRVGSPESGASRH